MATMHATSPRTSDRDGISVRTKCKPSGVLRGMSLNRFHVTNNPARVTCPKCLASTIDQTQAIGTVYADIAYGSPTEQRKADRDEHNARNR